MKITQVRAHVLRSKLEQPFSFSQGWVSSRGATLVEVQTDEGVTGWGEALCQGLQPPQIAAASINHALKDLVVEELRTRTRFVKITSAGIRESHVHDVTITKEAPNYRTE